LVLSFQVSLILLNIPLDVVLEARDALNKYHFEGFSANFIFSFFSSMLDNDLRVIFDDFVKLSHQIFI